MLVDNRDPKERRKFDAALGQAAAAISTRHGRRGSAYENLDGTVQAPERPGEPLMSARYVKPPPEWWGGLAVEARNALRQLPPEPGR